MTLATPSRTPSISAVSRWATSALAHTACRSPECAGYATPRSSKCWVTLTSRHGSGAPGTHRHTRGSRHAEVPQLLRSSKTGCPSMPSEPRPATCECRAEDIPWLSPRVLGTPPADRVARLLPSREGSWAQRARSRPCYGSLLRLVPAPEGIHGDLVAVTS